jgi:hypothetical protein
VVTQPSPRGHGRRDELDGREEPSSSPLKEAKVGCSERGLVKGNEQGRVRALFKKGARVHRAPGLDTDEGGGGSRWLVELGGVVAALRGGATALAGRARRTARQRGGVRLNMGSETVCVRGALLLLDGIGQNGRRTGRVHTTRRERWAAPGFRRE